MQKETSDSLVWLNELKHLRTGQKGMKTQEGTWDTGAWGVPQDKICSG